MKPKRRSFPRSARASQRRILGNGGRVVIGSKGVRRNQVGNMMMDQSPEVGQTIAQEQLPDAFDLEKLLHFSQQLYAHSLTLQEIIRNEGELTYEVLRPRYDRQAAQQFEIFHHAYKRSPRFRKRGVSL